MADAAPTIRVRISGQCPPARPEPQPPLTILHVLAPAPVGGLESVVRSLAAGQRRRGHRVAVALIVESPEAAAALEQPLRAADVETFVVVIGRRAYLRERSELTTLCRSLAPDVVHTHGYREDIIAGAAARALGIPTVSTVHGFTGGDFKNRLYAHLQRRAFRNFDAVVAVARSVHALLASSIPAARLRLIVNAYDGLPRNARAPRNEARAALGIPGGGVRLGWVGRLSHEKGADIAIEALALLGDLPVMLSLVGGGPEEPRLRERAEALGIASRITWHGIVPDAARLYAAFDLLVHSSRTEGTPIVLLEAMAASIPIVATAVGGVPDLLGPREALLVPPDDPAALAAAIRETLRTPQSARQRVHEAAHRLSQHYAVDPWLDGYDRVYRSARKPRAVS